MDQRQLMDWPPTSRAVDAARRSGLFTSGPVVAARAPGRLDVMGGIADYTGSLVCEMPLAVAAAAVVQRRDDDQIVCRSEQAGRCVTLSVAALSVSDAAAVRAIFDRDDAWASYPIGCWWHLHQSGANVSGCTILIDSDVPLGGGVSSSAAIEVATMTALCELFAVTMSPMQLAAACQTVENHVVGAPCGVMDQATACLGRHGGMLELLCQPDPAGLPAQVLGDVEVPPQCAFVGIHSGVSHEVSGDPYTDTRVAAFMGQRILSDATPHDWLANIDPESYQRELRDTLPQTMTGEAFIKQYTATRDPVTKVQPDRTYHVRAAVDHHVLEMTRVRRFVALLRQRPCTDAHLREAGELMLESHRSYGDNARLGHAMTDLIVEMAMAIDGVYGAKITGGGCGGTVALLIRDDPAVRHAIENLRSRYTRDTGRPTLLFVGTSPGAAAIRLETLS
jgi:galactokinase